MITSRQNPKIKNVVRLRKASERQKQNRILVEGEREILRAVQSGIRIESLFVCPVLLDPGSFKKISPLLDKNSQVEEVSEDVFAKMAYREGTESMLAVAVPRRIGLDDIAAEGKPLLIVLESVEKPGNLGAVMRTADASGVDAVIISDPRTDVYNPNTIRSSVGCVFSIPVVTCTAADAIAWLKNNGINTYATSLEASDHYLDADYTGPTAFVLGTEADGLSQAWIHHADHRIRIPMKGIADSLNVSVTAAIVVFEALRQRRLKT